MPKIKTSVGMILILTALLASCWESSKTTGRIEINYGDNLKAGKYLFVNGVNIYYEVYGDGDPLIFLHGNGGNIEGMK